MWRLAHRAFSNRSNYLPQCHQPRLYIAVKTSRSSQISDGCAALCAVCGPNLSPLHQNNYFTSVLSTAPPCRNNIFLICIKNAPNISLPLKVPPRHQVFLNYSPPSFSLCNQLSSGYFPQSSSSKLLASFTQTPLVSMCLALSLQIPFPCSSQSDPSEI